MSAYVSKEISNIKKYAKYGLLTTTEHAKNRMKERHLSERLIMQTLTQRMTYIIQYHPVGTYHQNKDELFVCYAKITNGKNSYPLHIVVSKNQKRNQYSIITCYIPDDSIFRNYGRELR